MSDREERPRHFAAFDLTLMQLQARGARIVRFIQTPAHVAATLELGGARFDLDVRDVLCVITFYPRFASRGSPATSEVIDVRASTGDRP